MPARHRGQHRVRGDRGLARPDIALDQPVRGDVLHKIARDLGWQPRHGFEAALRQTVRWYLENEAWWRPILDGRYRTERLGLAAAS